MDDTTNPVEPEVADVSDDMPETETLETEAPEIELDEDGNPVEQPEPDEPEDEDVEYEGKQYKLPREIKDALLRQADYTRKTQEVAEMRKSVEATLQQAEQISQAERQLEAQFIGNQQAIQSYQNIDWRAWAESDPVAAQQARYEMEDLRAQQGQLAAAHAQARAQRLALAQQETARRNAEGQKVLIEKIPGWGEEKQRALATFAQKEFGFTAEELNEIDDPRAILVLNAAMSTIQQQQRAAKTKKVAAQQAIKPAATVRTGNASVPRGADDRASIDSWMKARNQQVRQR